MRHRIGSINTGLGNPSECLLPNTWSGNNKLDRVVSIMLQDALKLKPIVEDDGLDFKVNQLEDQFSIDFGCEPAYQYDSLFIYHIENDKSKCGVRIGEAKGAYGSNIEITLDISFDESDIEFKELVNKWHNKLLEAI